MTRHHSPEMSRGRKNCISRERKNGRSSSRQHTCRRTARAGLCFCTGGEALGRLAWCESFRTPWVYEHTVGLQQTIAWLDPIDVDDSQHWLLSNLELHVASQLDPGNQYFTEYLGYVSELPPHSGMPINRDTVLSRLNRIKAIFARCYKKYIEETGKTVVITFDTVEAIHGMYILRTLTHWMKALPGTLFILAGRMGSGADDWRDSIKSALEDPLQGMGVTEVPLGEFDVEACREYLSQIRTAAHLSEDEIEKLICLTQGYPLWLALTVDYLVKVGMPEETHAPLEDIISNLPYHGLTTNAGRALAESFKHRLVAPYKGTDFWHEAIKRLAVVRESISEPIWQQLMADRPQPNDASDPDDVLGEPAPESNGSAPGPTVVTLHCTTLWLKNSLGESSRFRTQMGNGVISYGRKPPVFMLIGFVIWKTSYPENRRR